MQDPRNPLFGALHAGKGMYFGRVSKTRFSYIGYTIYAAASLAGDGSPGRQCKDLMTYVCVYQAKTCGVPIMVENVGQRHNERDGHLLHIQVLKLSFWGVLAQNRLSLHA